MTIRWSIRCFFGFHLDQPLVIYAGPEGKPLTYYECACCLRLRR